MFKSLTTQLSLLIIISVGAIHLSMSRLNIRDDITIVLELFVGLLVCAVFIHRFVTLPLNSLMKSMCLLEQGNSNAKTTINGSRQIRALGERFNLMVDRVIALMDSTAQTVFELAQAQERAQHSSHLLVINQELEQSLAEVKQLGRQQESLFLGVINALVSAVEASDEYTHGHSARVTRYSMALAARVGLPAQRIKVLEQAAILHDIGKIGIEKAILHKQDKLTDAEYSSMKQHPGIATKILQHIEHLAGVQDFVGKHHERYDGKGYPHGISGTDLPLEARIMAIADTFDAMTSNRPYRKGLPVEIAVQELSSNAGSQFDPELTEHFIALLHEGALTEILETPRRDTTQ